jgi:hypothetical protein
MQVSSNAIMKSSCQWQYNNDDSNINSNANIDNGVDFGSIIYMSIKWWQRLFIIISGNSTTNIFSHQIRIDELLSGESLSLPSKIAAIIIIQPWSMSK